MFFLMTTPQLTPNSPPIQYYNPAELQYKTLNTPRSGNTYSCLLSFKSTSQISIHRGSQFPCYLTTINKNYYTFS